MFQRKKTQPEKETNKTFFNASSFFFRIHDSQKNNNPKCSMYGIFTYIYPAKLPSFVGPATKTNEESMKGKTNHLISLRVDGPFGHSHFIKILQVGKHTYTTCIIYPLLCCIIKTMVGEQKHSKIWDFLAINWNPNFSWNMSIWEFNSKVFRFLETKK